MRGIRIRLAATCRVAGSRTKCGGRIPYPRSYVGVKKHCGPALHPEGFGLSVKAGLLTRSRRTPSRPCGASGKECAVFFGAYSYGHSP